MEKCVGILWLMVALFGHPYIFSHLSYLSRIANVPNWGKWWLVWWERVRERERKWTRQINHWFLRSIINPWMVTQLYNIIIHEHIHTIHVTMLCDSSNNVYFMHKWNDYDVVCYFHFFLLSHPLLGRMQFIENCAFNCKNKSKWNFKKTCEKNGHNVSACNHLSETLKMNKINGQQKRRKNNRNEINVLSRYVLSMILSLNGSKKGQNVNGWVKNG